MLRKGLNLISQLKAQLKKESNKKIISNTFSLSGLRAINLIFPLITFPYLVKVLGVEKFGLLAFSSAIIMYLQMLTRYGFDLTGVKDISVNRSDKAKVVEIFSSIMSVRIILMIFSFLFLNLVVFSIDKLSNDWLLYYITFGLVIGDVLFPTWFFQGMEEMKWITYLNIGVRIFFTALIFVFIKAEIDFLYVPILNSVGMIIAGLISLYVIKRKFNVIFKPQSLDRIILEFKTGWYIFTSRISVSMYTTVNVIILGFFTNNMIVGYFDIANRIVKIITTLFNSFTQAIFPNISNQYEKSTDTFYVNFKKILYGMLPVLIALTIISNIVLVYFLPYLVKDNTSEIIYIFIVFCIYGTWGCRNCSRNRC
jgi:PST family polysaccharide transporter